MSDDTTIAERLAGVLRRITTAAERADRDPSAVRLVAITKGVQPEQIDMAIAAGVTDIGENRVQEAARKQSAIAAPVTWHLVGHLQRNKAARAATMFDVVHSVDSVMIAQALATHRSAHRDPVRILVEVELTGMPQRAGVKPEETEAVVSELGGLHGTALAGLMTIAPPVDDPEAARPYFRRLRELRDHVQQATGHALAELSMGMSGDFAVAVEEGATMVRVGGALFAS